MIKRDYKRSKTKDLEGLKALSANDNSASTPMQPVNTAAAQPPDPVNHPRHYGGADDPYEAVKIIEALGFNFNIGSVMKYLARAGRKGDRLTDLEKARWYLDREIETTKGNRKDSRVRMQVQTWEDINKTVDHFEGLAATRAEQITKLEAELRAAKKGRR